MTAIVWLRRDLRLRDHPALRTALDRHEHVIPFFCLDDRLLGGRFASGPRTQFMLEALADLDAGLRDRGGALVIRRGPPEQELARLIEQSGADEVHFTQELTPFGRGRGLRVRSALERTSAVLCAHPGLTVADDVTEIRTQQDRPYTVFSPFRRNWSELPRRPVLQAPRAVQLPATIEAGEIPGLADLGLEQEVAEPMAGGESEGNRRLERFLAGPVDRYRRGGQDDLARDGTSRLSAYLHFGCVSPLQIEARLAGGEGPQAFRRQLCWRDFYHHVLWAHPDNARQEYQERYRGTIDWVEDGDLLTAWQHGRTGYPLVDAGMRQLLREGWMHNRARLVVGSFLTKDLGIDWREGEAWFMRLLLDGDEANNNGNWQWIASVGTDPQPYFRRIYNQALHIERFDPEGIYVRRYVPELASVPDRWLSEPWEMPEEVQRDCGCVIGRDYPEPIVDRRAAREAAKARYRAAAG